MNNLLRCTYNILKNWNIKNIKKKVYNLEYRYILYNLYVFNIIINYKYLNEILYNKKKILKTKIYNI